MSETIVEKKEKDTEVIDKNKIDGDIGDTIIQDDELFVIEEVSDKKDTKSDKDDKPKPEDLGKKPEKSEKGESDEPPKVEITESMRVKILETKIGTLGEEIAHATLTPDQIRDRVPLVDMKADIKRQRTILLGIDKELNPDEWSKQNLIISTLDGDITDKERNVRMDERFSSADNKDFLKNEQKLLSKKGFDFSDVQFDAIAGAAKPYLTDGKYSSEAIQKGLTDILGADTVSKMYETASEQKIREDLKKVATKVTKSVRVTRDGTSVTLVPLTKQLLAITDPDELDMRLDKLSSKQLAIYKRALKKQKK